MEFACYADWESLPESAHSLFANAARDSVFFSRPWFENLAQHALEGEQSMQLACVREGDRVLAILPLLKQGEDQWRPLGHLYTALYSPLLAEHAGQDTLACLAGGLGRLPLKSLRLDPFSENDNTMQDLQAAMESCGFSCHRYFRFYNWVHQLQGQSFAEYMAERPSRLRNTIERKQRKLEREHRCTLRIYTYDEVDRAVSDYRAVYAASWKVSELFEKVVEGLALSMSNAGWLRLGILYIDDQPAAAQFWFVVHKKASIFKLAYDEKWKRYSPGSILTRHLMKHAIDVDAVDEIDFLTGNDAYKRDWMSERRERWGMRCVNTAYRQPNKNRLFKPIVAWVSGFRQLTY